MRNLIFVYILLFINCLLCDTIYLKNGNKVTGKIISKDKSGITVEVAYGKIFVSRKNIKKIVRESIAKTIISQSNRLIALGANAQGISHLKKAIRKYPQKKSLRNALAELYFRLGKKYSSRNPQKALDFFVKAQKINRSLDISSYQEKIQTIQDESLAIKNEADNLYKHTKYAQALKKYKECIKQNSDLQNIVAKTMAECSSHLGNQSFRNKEYTKALELYDFALKHNPKIYPYIEQQWLYCKTQFIGEHYLLKKDWNGAIVELQEILKHRPDYPLALFMTGTCLEKLKKYGEAFKYYGSTVDNPGEWDRKFTSLEQARLRAQQIVSRQSLQPFFVPQDSVPTKNWVKTATKHFNIYYQNRQLAEKVASTLEYHWRVILQKLAPKNWNDKWPMLCDVYIFPSREEYMKNTGLPQWSDGVSQIAFQQGRLFQHKIYLYASAPLLLSNIIPHELTHVMYPWFLKYRVSLPLWLNEGVSMTSEADFRTLNRRFVLRRALKRGNIFPLAKLLTMDKYPQGEEGAAIFYSQSLSLTQFLVKRGGNQKLLSFAKKAKTDVKSALREVYGISSISTLERLWLVYAKN